MSNADYNPSRKIIVCQHCGDIRLSDDGNGKFKCVCTCGFADRKNSWKDSPREAVKAWNRIAYNWY